MLGRSIRVIVVDDSALMRMMIQDMLTSDPEIEVVEKGQDGQEAVEKTVALRPDVVVLDIEMPRLDGLAALKKIMRQCPTKVVVLTGITEEKVALDALGLGAVDLVLKPSGTYSPDINKVKRELIKKVKTAAQVDLGKIKSLPVQSKPLVTSLKSPLREVVAIGASTGGPRALETILPSLPGSLSVPILIVQHLPGGFTKSLAERLDSLSQIEVKEASNGEKLKGGRALIAPAGYHMTVEKQNQAGVIRLDNLAPPILGLRPSADKMMQSVAEAYGDKAVGVLLSGMGRDGALGLQAIKERKGKAIAQNEASSVVFGMPKAAIEAGYVDRVVPLQQIAEEILRAVQS